MVTGLRYGTAALLVALCAFASTGCRHKKGSDTTINESNIFTTDSFPGADVQDGNVADDQRAMSVSGEDFSGPLKVFYNGDRGIAIATYLVLTPGGPRLYAHYFSDGNWTPPVALGADDCALTTVDGNTEVAWLNTENHSSDFARNRNGDAIVFWTANDGTVGAAGDGVNRNLWGTYFRAADSGEIAKNYGFEALAQRISTNEDDNVGGTGEDVSTFGLVSDGLCGEARWTSLGSASFSSYTWGNDTTEIVVFWRQSSDNDPVAGYQDDEYWAFARYDLGAAVTADLPLPASAPFNGPIVDFGASDSGLSSEETMVFPEFVSYNNVLFFKVSADADAGSVAGYVPAALTPYGTLTTEDKITVQEVAFDLNASTVSSADTLHSTTPSALVGDTTQCNSSYALGGGFLGGFVHQDFVYGSDEGLSVMYAFTYELTSDPNTTFGEVTSDGQLRVTEIDEATGALVGGNAAFIDVEDTLISDTTIKYSSKISRNGDYIMIGFMKPIDAGAAGPTTEDQNAVFAAEIITTRIDGDGVFVAPPVLSSTLSSATQLSTIITTAAVGQNPRGYEFQFGLGYVCGIQSDPDVMHIFFEHSDSASGDTVWDARLTADLDPAGGCVPTDVVAIWETFTREGDMTDFNFVPNINHFDMKEFDSGEGGNIVSFYFQDIDGTGGTDFRFQAEKSGVAGGKVEIDSNSTSRQISQSQAYPYAVTEWGSDIGAFDLVSGNDSDQRPHALNTVDIFFRENQVSEVDGLPLVNRTRRFIPGDLSVGFGDQFVPNAGTAFVEPFYPGASDASLTTNSILGLDADFQQPVDGDVVGVYFTQSSRVYFQQSSGNGNDVVWENTDGVSNPFLVDDDTDEEIQGVIGVFTRSCACNRLFGSMVFWTKAFTSGSGGSFSSRLQVRVHDDHN